MVTAISLFFVTWYELARNSYKYRPLAGVPCISADGQTVDIFMRYSLLNAKKILVFP